MKDYYPTNIMISDFLDDKVTSAQIEALAKTLKRVDARTTADGANHQLANQPKIILGIDRQDPNFILILMEPMHVRNGFEKDGYTISFELKRDSENSFYTVSLEDLQMHEQARLSAIPKLTDSDKKNKILDLLQNICQNPPKNIEPPKTGLQFFAPSTEVDLLKNIQKIITTNKNPDEKWNQIKKLADEVSQKNWSQNAKMLARCFYKDLDTVIDKLENISRSNTQLHAHFLSEN